MEMMMTNVLHSEMRQTPLLRRPIDEKDAKSFEQKMIR